MNEPEATPNMEAKCPQCGVPLPSGGLAGLCPACLLQQGATETSTQPEMPPFQPPSVEELARLFPQLEIIALIGKGGMGAVYQARQPVLDRIVALKILPARTTGGADFTERFNREARALARLNHPNIVTVHEFGQVNGMPYFLMEYVDGMNLRQLEQAGKLSPREALQIVPQICEALQFAHDAGVVHRDIKPDNILLDKKGRVKIADFGIAKIMGGPPDSAVPETQGAIGTPHYMAPEQVEKPQTVDHRADIFSLGVVFYEMLTGELPLGKFAPPSSGPRGLRVDVRLDEVVLRALEKEPSRRYQHASQVKTAVETIAGTPPGSPPGAPPNGPQPPPYSGPSPEAILARDYVLDIGACLRRGWALVKAYFWPLVGMTALILVILSLADSAFSNAVNDPRDSSVTMNGVSILLVALNGPLFAGLFLYFLQLMRGGKPTVETAFSGFTKRFLHLFLAHFVITALTVLGFFCLVLPGIYLWVAWFFTLPLILDKGLDFWPAMELSRKMVHKHWWLVFALMLVLAAVWVSGLLACCIGIFLTATVAIAAYLYAYEDIFGSPTASAFGQPLPPPPIAGAGPARPAGAASPINPPNADGPSAAGPAGPIGPTGTVVFPSAPVTPPSPRSGSGISKFILIALAVLLGLVLLTLAHHSLGFTPSVMRMNSHPAFGIALLPVIIIVAVTALIALIIVFRAIFKPSANGSTLGTLLKLVLAGFLFLLIMVMIGGALFLGFFRHTSVSSYSVHSGRWTQPTAPMFPLQPLQPAQPMPLWKTPPGQGISTVAYNNFIERTRQELGKASIRFDNLHLTANSPGSVMVSLAGLQAHQIMDGTNSWQTIAGSLMGQREGSGKWMFTGRDDLTAVRFDIAKFDVKKVLAADAAHWGGQSTSATPPAAFGPVREFILLSRAAGTNEFLNLSSGNLFAPPAEIAAALNDDQPGQETERHWQALDIPQDSRRFSYIKWLSENGVDLMCAGPGKVIGFDGTFAIAHGNSSTNWYDWDSLTVEQAARETGVVDWVRRATAATQHGLAMPPAPPNSGTAQPATQLDSQYPGGPLVNLLTRDQSVIWYFKTRTGTLGILQILEVTNNPDAVKIRYKLADKIAAETSVSAATTGLAAASPAPAVSADTLDNLQARLEAAQSISQYDIKDKALQTLSLEAANAGDVELAKSALGQMSEFDVRDAATREAALVLARNGRRKEAVDIAQGISEYALRDKTLSELAQ